MLFSGKKINTYTKNFINDLHITIKNSVYVNSDYINEKDINIIDDVVSRYHPKIFWAFYKDNHEILHYPERAVDFNKTLILLFMEAIRLVYVVIPSYSTVEKELYIESLIKFAERKICSLESSDITNIELVNKIKDEIFEEYEKILKQHGENVSSMKHTLLQQVQEYCKIKINETYTPVINYISETDIIHSKTFSKIVIMYAVLGILLPFVLNIFHINRHIIYIVHSVYYFVFIIIAMLFPIYMTDVRKQFEKIKYLNRPYDYYSCLGTDMITVYVADNQLEYADPEYKNILLPAISDVRMQLTDEYGFVMSGVRVSDTSDFVSGYKILLRGNEVCHLDFDISKNVIYQKDVEKYNIQLPENVEAQGVNGELYYQAEQNFCDNLPENSYCSGVEFFKKTFKEIIMQHIDILFTIEETVAMFEMYKHFLSGQKLTSAQISQLDEKFDIYDLKNILVKILQKRCSLKDLSYVFERIINYSKMSTDCDYIAFQICNDLKNMIKE